MKTKKLFLATLFFMCFASMFYGQETEVEELEYFINPLQYAFEMKNPFSGSSDYLVEYRKVPMPLRESAIQAIFGFDKNAGIIQLNVDDVAEEGIGHSFIEVDPATNKMVNYYQKTTGPEGTTDFDKPDDESLTRNWMTEWQNSITQMAQNTSPVLVLNDTVVFYSALTIPGRVLNEEIYRMPRSLFKLIAPEAEKNTFNKTIKLNEKSPANPIVKQLQTMLIDLGFNSFGNITGIFDAKTLQAVQKYQTDNSLINQTGTVDEETWNDLALTYIRYNANRQ